MATTYTVTHDFATDDLIVADYVDANFTCILDAINALDAGNLASGTVALARISGLTSTQCAAAFFKDEDDMTSDSATAVSSQQAIAAYATGRPAAAMTPSSYAAEESVTFANSVIMKMGHSSDPSGDKSSGNVAITFGTEFPNAIISVVATIRNDTGINYRYSTDSVSTTGFTFYYSEYSGTHAADGFDWIAIGY